jgi:hypothetical protein
MCSNAQYVTLQKKNSHPSLVIYFFASPPIKLKLGQQIGEGLLIANHLDQSLWWANQKHWAAVRSYLIHSFLEVHNLGAPFTSHCKLCHYAEPKSFSSAKLAYFDFFHLIFICRVRYWAPLEVLQEGHSWVRVMLSGSVFGYLHMYFGCASDFVMYFLHEVLF